MAVSRIGYISIFVMDLQESERHYTDVIGLRVTARTPTQVYLQAHEAQDHHCIVLNAADHAGVDHFGVKVSDPEDLDEAEAAARERDLPTRRVGAGEVLGQGDGVEITLPTGHRMNLFYHSEKVGYSYGMKDPDVVFEDVNGISPVTHLDHILLAGPNLQETLAFLRDVLDFSLTEQVNGPDGEMFVFFVTSSNTMHNLAISAGPPNRLHHIAFGVNDRADVIRRVDMLKKKGIATFDFGLSRHGIAGVTTAYFFDPSGNRNEFETGVYEASVIPGEVQPVVWAGPDVMRGLFYYELGVPELFFEVMT